MGRALDLTGKTFGRLTAVKPTAERRDRKIVWEFRCSCGNTHLALAKKVKSGHTKSCGCLQADSMVVAGLAKRGKYVKHGMCSHKFYETWKGMIKRCYLPSSKDYANYHGRGITTYHLWRSDPRGFISFLETHLGDRPKGHTLDRIDNNRGYFPDNLRWADAQTQYDNSIQKKAEV